MPFITVRDLRIYFELRGTGLSLLGIGGTGGDLRRFPTVFEMLPAQDFEILAYDQRGLGRTSRPDIPYTMADYADDAQPCSRRWAGNGAWWRASPSGGWSPRSWPCAIRTGWNDWSWPPPAAAGRAAPPFRCTNSPPCR